MTRLVRGADGIIGPDAGGKAAGRGTYVCEDPACREPQRLAEAVQRALGAAFEPGALVDEENHAAT